MRVGYRYKGYFAQMTAQGSGSGDVAQDAGIVVHFEPAAQGGDHAGDFLAVDLQRAAYALKVAGFEAGEAVEMSGLNQVFSPAEHARRVGAPKYLAP